ncbi:MAG: PAS domain S-box protein [Desulfohalobiaceae bacterium]|nr:PAS domain S-box protein [Desulfohalobiaceae bacterium]
MKLPLHKRIVFWLLLPVILVGAVISGLLIRSLSSPMESFLTEHFESNLRLASRMGLGVCDTYFNQLLEMRQEDNPDMNQAFKHEALQEMKSIGKEFLNVHLMVVENGHNIRMTSLDLQAESWNLPEDVDSSDKEAVLEAKLAGSAVKASIKTFPFWGWHIVSFVLEKDYQAPMRSARHIVYLSTLGVLAAVFATLLVVFHAFVRKPLNRLVLATENVSSGKLLKVEPARENEIGRLTAFFNRMGSSLQNKQDEVDRLIEQLQESEQRYRSLVDLSPDAVLVVQDGVITYLNHSGAGMFCATAPADLIGEPIREMIHPDYQEIAHLRFQEIERGLGSYFLQEFKFITREEQLIDGEATGTSIVYSGQPAVLCVVRDISERKRSQEEKKRLEEQFHQAQKLESVGRLAGGVAHDLNNLLSPILGYGEMLLEDANDKDAEPLEEMVNAGRRARDLVRQLLAFSRKQSLEVKHLDLNELVSGFEKLLRRTMREDIAIHMVLEPDLPVIDGDAGQLEQVIMNLAVNAQDAMPEGGMLTLETAQVELDRTYAAEHKGVTPGSHAMLAVTDTGVGMDAETRERLFEPFFTTKPKDKGTGLGLASVYGIVKQHGGNIWTYSEPGRGSTFKIYLPVSAENVAVLEKPLPQSSPDVPGTETILLAEDEDQVRNLARIILERHGYTVLDAGSGKEALDVLDRYQGPLQLLLTDVVMPDVNGRQLFEQVLARSPDIRALYMSGYTENVIAHHGVLDPDVHFIQKPFTVNDLLAKVRETLEA